jgi:hypothetical protein
MDKRQLVTECLVDAHIYADRGDYATAKKMFIVAQDAIGYEWTMRFLLKITDEPTAKRIIQG